MEIETIIKNSFTIWLKDFKTWKYIIANIFLTISFAILIFLPLAGGFAGAFISFFSSRFNPTAIINFFLLNIPMTIFILLVFFISVILSKYITVLIQLRALQLNELKTESLSVIKLLKVIVLNFFVLIAIFLSLYNKKLMIGSVAYLLILFLTLISFEFFSGLSTILPAILALLSIPYIIIILYNGTKLSLAESIFLHKQIGITQAAKESWEITKGHVLLIFILPLIITFVLSVIYQIAGVVGSTLGSGLDLFFAAMFISIILSSLFSAIVNIILQPVSLHVHPAIYTQLQSQIGIEAEKASTKQQFN